MPGAAPQLTLGPGLREAIVRERLTGALGLESNPKHALGGENDLESAGCHRKSRHILRCRPSHRQSVVVCDTLARKPWPAEADDRIVRGDIRPGAIDDLGNIEEPREVGFDARLLPQLAASGVAQRFTPFNVPAGQAPNAFERRLRALRDEHAAVAPNAGAHPETRHVHGSILRAMKNTSLIS